jgi:hypothetical protein
MVALSSVESPVTYRVDSHYNVIAGNPAWHEFYKENGDGRSVNAFIGDNLFDHIHSRELQGIYRRIFDFARNHRQPIVLRFRCDSPCFKREMEMRITHTAEGGFDFCNRVITETPWPLEVLRHDWPPIGILCGWCNRVKVNQEWHELPQALRMLNAFPETTRISHGVCPQCKALLFSSLK